MSGHGLANAAQPMLNQLQGLANAAFNQQYNQYQAQQAQAAQYNQILMQRAAAGLAGQQHNWMVNGKTMTFEQFVDEICPDKDDPHRSYLILKYKGVK